VNIDGDAQKWLRLQEVGRSSEVEVTTCEQSKKETKRTHTQKRISNINLRNDVRKNFQADGFFRLSQDVLSSRTEFKGGTCPPNNWTRGDTMSIVP